MLIANSWPRCGIKGEECHTTRLQNTTPDRDLRPPSLAHARSLCRFLRVGSSFRRPRFALLHKAERLAADGSPGGMGTSTMACGLTEPSLRFVAFATHRRASHEPSLGMSHSTLPCRQVGHLFRRARGYLTRGPPKAISSDCPQKAGCSR